MSPSSALPLTASSPLTVRLPLVVSVLTLTSAAGSISLPSMAPLQFQRAESGCHLRFPVCRCATDFLARLDLEFVPLVALDDVTRVLAKVGVGSLGHQNSTSQVRVMSRLPVRVMLPKVTRL
jgi:hypothetical protein